MSFGAISNVMRCVVDWPAGVNVVVFDNEVVEEVVTATDVIVV